MRSCYDNTDDRFTCQLQKIKCLYAERVYDDYRQSRYGIGSCNNEPDLEEVSDIKELIEYIDTMDISGFSSNTYRNTVINNKSLLGMSKTGCIPDFAVETLKVCNISNLLEKINSL